VSKLERRLEAAEAAERTIKQATADLETRRKWEADARKRLEASGAALKKAENVFERARAVVAEREGKLPKNVRTRAGLDRALRQARTDLETLMDAFETARQRESEARQRHAEAKAALKAADKTSKAVERKSQQAQARFARRLETAGFSGPRAYEEARLSDGELESLTREIDEHEAGLKAAGLRLTRARQAVRGKKRPDLEALESRAEDAKTRSDETIKLAAEVRKEHDHVSGLCKEWASIERRTKTLERRYSVAGKIADVANGKNDRGIAFQRFVLAAILDEVLSAATQRLTLMTRGRFTLHRAGERADRRHAGGLDLEVFDTFSGSTRPVSTLSGGETFLAALSLALGLADVVQVQAGGMYLETIFIDEGFGSLDPEALDLAVRALMDLQAGNRLVGIISHVPELRERIDVRLEIRSSRGGGSRAAFVGT
jgi:exonuclease SbcC